MAPTTRAPVRSTRQTRQARGVGPARRGTPLPQRSFDDLGQPLFDVTFCVIDLETTGGSPETCAITEVGAVKVRGGQCLGTFQTLVNPGAAIPPEITVLTGITQAMVIPAPRIETVLPSLVEFVGAAVVVGHNVRFDLGFLRAALRRAERPPLTNPSVDTCTLARRLVRDEVPNCKLGTLSSRFRLDHRPNHRALDDALATADLLHILLERAAGLGVTGLDDLIALPTMAGSAQATKLSLTASLPREPGVYLFRDRGGRVLYVGKATNLRSRVRSYFAGDTRRKVPQLLREVHVIDHQVCSSTLEAAVREVRLIHEHQPRFNRQSKDWSRYTYLKLTLAEAFPRLSVVRVVRDDGALYLGPLSSTRQARRVAEAIETAVPLRRCTATPGRSPRSGPCAPAQLGVASCPCAGTISRAEYRAVVERAVTGIRRRPELLLEPLEARMAALAAEERFEEAADVRERAAALAQALRRQRQLDGLLGSGRVILEIGQRSGAELVGGQLQRAWLLDQLALGEPVAAAPVRPVPLDPHGAEAPLPVPPPLELADELRCVASWLSAQAAQVRLVDAEHGLSERLPRLPSYQPRTRPGEARRGGTLGP
jgi:DNA polymerase III subunit epsilon